jgi:hypothetical protein
VYNDVVKAIINGRRFDTQAPTTKLVATFVFEDESDFDRFEESLYRTGHGNFFLVGYGGARTRYAQRTGDGWRGGEKLLPLSAVEALAWLEEHGFVDAIEQWFADRIQDA